MRMQISDCRFQIAGRGLLLCLMILCVTAAARAQPARKKNAPPPPEKMPPVTAEEAAKLEAVITTDQGVIRFEFFFDKAPKHVQQFIRLARAGYYDGSAFHRVIARGLIQGGDPLLKDANTPRTRWGTGGLNQIEDEFSDLKHTKGVVSAVRIPGRANSGGTQFFICWSPQPQLDGQFSAFGQVTEGLEVVQQISLTQADEKQLTLKPVRIQSLRIEPKKTEPFRDASVDEMRREVLLRTTLGDITVALDPELAPEHCRNFLKLVETRWYDHTAFHRVVPGFVVQGGMGSTRAGGPGHPADRWVHNLKGEFSQTRKHLRGALSMARTNDPDSAQTSFFIVLAPAPYLDGKYTIFGKVVDGFEVLDKMEQAPRDGETPRERIELIEAVIKP
ncbi:MAG TPA: peptidylprolyl isomerase [Blastocatellia bacterium]|nr:peptidylprolyl isomerase [Blastocatellia bacterium]